MIAVLVAIGCGGDPSTALGAPSRAKSRDGGKPQDASATTKTQDDAPVQLAQAPEGAAPSGGGGSASVQGAVRLEGAAPAPGKVQMAADPVCQQQHAEPVYTEAVVVSETGMLQNVFVHVKTGLQGPFPPTTTPVTLNQSGCWYAPHVFGIQVNQPLEILNSDSTLHNVNAKPANNQPFNVAQPVKGMKTTKKFTKPEAGVAFKCNVHPWMSAYAHVVEHPHFSVSGADGSFAITGLPAGTYEVEAWHERYGTQTQTVTVGDGEVKTAEFTFKAQ
jgi:hypothetical protein